MQEAAKMAQKAVTNPVEGTILTVSRETADAAMRMAKNGANLKQMMSAMITEAKKSVKKTPELLPQLKEAGVVDAGGKGLLYIYQGMSNYLTSRFKKFKEDTIDPVNRKIKQEIQAYGYDVQFLIRGQKMPLEKMQEDIKKMGKSVIVVGDKNLIRVHIHAENPDTVMNYSRKHGDITDIVIENLDKQVSDFRNKIDTVPT
jgi:dihydroxyacetone kinase-like predicted kinase